MAVTVIDSNNKLIRLRFRPALLLTIKQTRNSAWGNPPVVDIGRR